MPTNWFKSKIVSSLINGKDRVGSRHRGNRCNGYGQTSVARSTLYYPSSPILRNWKPSTKPYTTRLSSCTGLREQENRKRLPILSPTRFTKENVFSVSEKMAALSVVQNRLAAIGLTPFCLEIHSNKTKKSAVISQLKETTEIIRQTPPEEFRKEAERLLNLRAELNQYIEALHKEYPFGVSLYDAIIHYQSVDVESCFDIPQAYLDTLDKDTFAQWEDAIELLVRTANACGHPYQHPLTGISITEYSSAVKEGSSQLLTGFIDLLTTIRQKLDVFSILLKDTDIHPTRKDFQTISHIIRRILDIPELTPGLLTLPLLNETLNEYREVVVHGRKRDEQRKEIETGFTQEILSINAKQMLAEWNRVSDQWFLPRYFGQRKIRKAINVYALKTIETEDIKPLLHRIIRYQGRSRSRPEIHRATSLPIRTPRQERGLEHH